MSKLVYSGNNADREYGSMDEFYGNRDQGSYGGYGNYSGPTVGFQGNAGPMPKWKKTIYGYICVLTDEKDETYDMYPISSQTMIKAFEGLEGFDYEWADFSPDKDYELPKDWKQGFYVYVNAKDIPTFVSKNRSVACCAYEATDKYMQHWLGMMLDSDDKSWYSLNSLVTSDGLPQKDSFAVIQQLIEPYGLGINSIIVPPNSRRFPEYAPFLMSLGCNPFFLGDGYTTNEKALEMMFPDENLRNTVGRELAKSWRFECREEPAKGCITMVQFQETKTGHNGGSTYRGPRSKGATNNAQGQRSWHMCITLDRLANIMYSTPMKLSDYAEYQGSVSFNFEGMKDTAGVRLGERMTAIRAEDNKKYQANVVPYKSPIVPILPQADKIYVPTAKKEKVAVTETEPVIMRCGSLLKDLGEITNDEFFEFSWAYDEDETAKAVAAFKRRKAAALNGTTPLADLFTEVHLTDAKIHKAFVYPPVCEQCQQSPGETFYSHSDGSRTKNCQWCGMLQEKNFDESAGDALRVTPILRPTTAGQW
jgi:hypothetical protein